IGQCENYQAHSLIILEDIEYNLLVDYQQQKQQQSCLNHANAVLQAAKMIALPEPDKWLVMAAPVKNAKTVNAEILASMRMAYAHVLKDAANNEGIDLSLYKAIHTPCTYILATLF
ncbi:unnamed protein product, partial [Owenia fusiformis]